MVGGMDGHVVWGAGVGMVGGEASLGVVGGGDLSGNHELGGDLGVVDGGLGVVDFGVSDQQRDGITGLVHINGWMDACLEVFGSLVMGGFGLSRVVDLGGLVGSGRDVAGGMGYGVGTVPAGPTAEGGVLVRGCCGGTEQAGLIGVGDVTLSGADSGVRGGLATAVWVGPGLEQGSMAVLLGPGSVPVQGSAAILPELEQGSMAVWLGQEQGSAAV
jgi:hypothetical protein